MKKVLLLFFVVFAISCNNPIREDVDVTVYESLSLDKTSLELNIGDSYQLKLSYTPSDLPSPKCTYTSSSPGVVSVNETGTLTALKEGSAKIIVTPAPGLNLAPCECTVVVKPTLTERITLSETSMNLNIGEKKTLTFQIYPSDATNKNVT
jgi:uncharacterized protein YjdB